MQFDYGQYLCLARGLFRWTLPLVCFLFSPIIPNTLLHGQTGPKQVDRYKVIDAEEGARRLEAFRLQRLEGDFCFRFELEHLPRRGSTVHYYGTMWGSWNENGPISRIELKTGAEREQSIQLILQNGKDAKAWLRNHEGSPFIALKGEALFAPIVSGVVYTPFDLQMPFIFWQNYSYEGPTRVRSRIAQNFLMYPPEKENALDQVHAVRVGIDDAYNTLLKIDIYEAEEQIRSSFLVESFKEVQGQWIVKRIVMKDNKSRNRTRFKVHGAAVGLNLPDEIFMPETSIPMPVLPDSIFEN